jgi:hypothetical protein
MTKARGSPRQLRLPFITYYVTRVDGVHRTAVSVVDVQTWQDLLKRERGRVVTVEHKGFEYGLVANLVLEGTEPVPEPPKARPWFLRLMSKLLPSDFAICGGSGRF